MKRVGIFGGTFDPIHYGHLLIAEWLRDAVPLDHVLFVPSAIPPHKQQARLTDASHRLAMVREAVAGHSAFGVSDVEMQSSRPSYTADTLAALRKQAEPDTQLYLILGEDNLYELPNWHEPRRIISLAHILVARRTERPQRPLPEFLNGAVTVVESPELEISSTMIRNRIQAGQSIRYLVPAPVEAYIRAHALYTGAKAGCTSDRPQ